MSEDSDKGVTTRSYSGYLIVDWRDAKSSNDVRFRKTEPTDPAPHEVTIPVSVDVTVPEVDVPSIMAEVEIPAPEVEEVVRSDIEDES